MSQQSRKKSQMIVAGVLGVAGIGGLWVVSQILNTDDGGFAGGPAESGVTTTMIADRTRAAAPEMSWIMDASDQVDSLQADVDRLTTALRILQENGEAERERAAAETDEVLARYEDTITQLEARLGAGQGGLTPADTSQNTRTNIPGADVLTDFFTPASSQRPDGPPLGPLGPNGRSPNEGAALPVQSSRSPQSSDPNSPFQDPMTRSFTLTPLPVSEVEAEADRPPHLSSYLPAGSYAPAIVLSGVDASTAVTSQAEPVPVIFRITSPAVTAGTRSTQGHTIDLTGCTVTGSARGDLSSERVYVRLLKLSCVQSGGHVFERDVSGYMSGAGKAGARGLVVSREGRLVSNAAVAGALGGLAEGVSSIGQAAQGSETASLSEALQGAGATSAAGGVSGAANRLSEYYIERAEQYQPVVSLYGGTAVELVFMEGVNLE